MVRWLARMSTSPPAPTPPPVWRLGTLHCCSLSRNAGERLSRSRTWLFIYSSVHASHGLYRRDGAASSWLSYYAHVSFSPPHALNNSLVANVFGETALSGQRALLFIMSFTSLLIPVTLTLRHNICHTRCIWLHTILVWFRRSSRREER